MSKDSCKNCFTISVNGRPFATSEKLEDSVSIAVGLHKMSRINHSIVVTDLSGSQVCVFKFE